MKFSNTVTLLSTAALAAAQFSFNQADNTFSCDQTIGVAAYCAGGPIIIRCSAGKGVAGNCNDNLAGQGPSDATALAGCYQTSSSAGDAACTKAGLVYPASGSGISAQTAPFPIPGIHPPPANNTRSNNPGQQPATAPFSNSTSDSSKPTGTRWSNSTITTASPVPRYTAGSGANSPITTLIPTATPPASPVAPVRYTGAAAAAPSSNSKRSYWAFAAFALIALF